MKTRRRCAPSFSCYPRKTAGGGGGVQTPPQQGEGYPRKTTIFVLGWTNQTRSGILYYYMEAIWKRVLIGQKHNWKYHRKKSIPPDFFRVTFPSIKETIPPCSKLSFIPKLHVKRFSTFHWSCRSLFPIKYCVACEKSTIKILINLGFVTSFEDSHYILLFRYIYGAQLTQWFCYSKHLHVNRNYRPNGTATSLSPKCCSANVPLDFCTTADFEMKYIFNEGVAGVLGNT